VGFKASSLYFKPPTDLQRRIQLSLRKAAKAEAAPRVMPKWWLSFAAPIAAAVIVVLSLVPLLTGPSADDLLAREVISSHVRSLMANHLADVPSSDQHTVKPWFNGKLDFSPPVEDLAEKGFRLAGGRLDYLENRSVAALVYQRQKHFINLFIWPSGSDSDVGTKAVSRQGYNLFYWTKSGMTYWAVSDLSKSELREFVQLVQDPVSAKLQALKRTITSRYLSGIPVASETTYLAAVERNFIPFSGFPVPSFAVPVHLS